MALQTFFKSLKGLWVGTYDAYNDLIIPSIIGTNPQFDMSKSDQVSSVYICIKTLSDTLSKLPLNIYIESPKGRIVDKADYRYPLLHYNPNNYTSQQTFFAALEYFRNLKGNSFARIYRDRNGFVTSLELLSPSRVTGYGVKNGELYYKILEGDEKSPNEITLNASELLHFRSLTRDGVWGINPIEAIRINVSSTWQGLTTLDSFYKNNATSAKAIKSTISGQNQKAMLEALNDFKAKYSGPVNAGTLIPLPPNTELMDVQINFVDAVFINTIKFNAGQIASLYGVPPHLVGLFEASKFNNVEQMMLDFKATTLTAIARMYRQELEFKLLTTEERINGKSIEWNLMALVEADSTTRINNERTLMGMGVITPNDIARTEGYTTFDGGEKHYLPGNYIALEDKQKTQPEKPVE